MSEGLSFKDGVTCATVLPLVSARYKHPAAGIPFRLKQGLVQLGIISSATVSEPWSQFGKDETELISRLIAFWGGREL